MKKGRDLKSSDTQRVQKGLEDDLEELGLDAGQLGMIQLQEHDDTADEPEAEESEAEQDEGTADAREEATGYQKHISSFSLDSAKVIPVSLASSCSS